MNPLWKRRYSAKETCNFIDPTDRSHPIFIPSAIPKYESCHTHDYAMSCHTREKNCHTRDVRLIIDPSSRKRVITYKYTYMHTICIHKCIHVLIHICIHIWIHTCMYHVQTSKNESCYIYVYMNVHVMSPHKRTITHMTYDGSSSHPKTESCHLYERVMLHTWVNRHTHLRRMIAIPSAIPKNPSPISATLYRQRQRQRQRQR